MLFVSINAVDIYNRMIFLWMRPMMCVLFITESMSLMDWIIGTVIVDMELYIFNISSIGAGIMHL